MRAALVVAVLFAGAAALGGCGQSSAPDQALPAVHGTQTQSQEEQIRSAIQAHLAQDKSLNIQSFDTNVTQVKVQGDHAQAQVDFRVKGGGGAMQFDYELDGRDGNWAVTQSNPVGAHSATPPAQ